MLNQNDQLVWHLDINGAYVSFEAVKLLQYGSKIDIREIPSAIGGNGENNSGIILAASIPAKKHGVKTGMPIYQAKLLCRDLMILPPDYKWYMKSSNAFYELLKEYSPCVERYSIDENFIDATHFKDNYKYMSMKVKMRIYTELGIRTNIGISTTKFLSKMAGDRQPRDMIHTLFKEEIPDKLWPLPVEELFGVGRSTSTILRRNNINTIGDIAHTDVQFLKRKLHYIGTTVYDRAHGIDRSVIRDSEYINNIKGLGNSTTTSFYVDNCEEALKVLLSLTENVAMRLRSNSSLCRVVVVSIKTSDFIHYSHQKALYCNTNSTEEIFRGIKAAFKEAWRGEKIRQLGVRVTKLSSNEYIQESLFDFEKSEKQRSLDKTLDELRIKYGKDSVIRSSFLHSGISPFNGGTGEEEYIMMRSIL